MAGDCIDGRAGKSKGFSKASSFTLRIVSKLDSFILAKTLTTNIKYVIDMIVCINEYVGKITIRALVLGRARLSLGSHILLYPDVIGRDAGIDARPVLQAALVAKRDNALQHPGIVTEPQ